MPVLVWAMLVMSVMVILAMPAIMVASTLLAMDRLVETHFFIPERGGDVVLWQHLFWFFGHPEVYIIFVPALGFVSQILVAFSRRPLVGYPAIVGSLVTTGGLGFALWAHHMFAAGMSHGQSVFFMVASMAIALPTGIQIFCWIATLWGTRPRCARRCCSWWASSSPSCSGASPAWCSPRCRPTSSSTTPSSWWPTCTTC